MSALRRHVAQALSILGHPMLFLPLAIAFARLGAAPPAEALLPVAVVLAAVLVVAGFVVRAKARDEVSDLDVSRREQRPRLYLLAMGAVSLSTLLLWRLGQPTPVWQGALVALGLLMACGLSNQLGIKASLHASFAVYAAAVLSSRSPVLGALGLGLAFSVGWSRLVLERHTRPEVALGLSLGLLSGVALHLLPL